MAVISVINLTFAYEGSYDNILENITLNLDTDWKLGLIGRNGRGKTTFLKLLMGEYEYSGTISKNVEFDYFPFEVKDKESFGIDIINEKAHLNENEYYKIQKELALLEVDDEILYQPFNTLSGGEQMKILFVSLFLKENAFLLIDEPTNHLDMQSIQIIGNYLKTKKGFILVSHDRNFIDNCVDRILSINKTNIEIQKGNFSSWYENKQRQENFELTQNEKLIREIKHLKKAAIQTADWSDKVEKTKIGVRIGGLRPDIGRIGHCAAKMMQRSKNLERRQNNAIEEKSQLLKNIEKTEDLKINFLKHSKNKIIEFQNISLFYGDKNVIDNINFEINQGDKIALCGKNGCGKSTVLKLIQGDTNINFSGNFFRTSNLKTSYISQDTSYLSGDLDNFALVNKIDKNIFTTILYKLGFSRKQFDKDVSDLSDGQKKKILIAKSLCEQAHLYIWDEPLNYIDIFSRIQIENLILNFNPTMIFVVHDMQFCKKIANKFINL